MPQLVPFYFVNAMITLIVSFAVLLWVLSALVLPVFPRTQLARMYIATL